ncbi:hypothetical protein [Macrococcus bovicus]|uniref:hypothetical protein n=1 Tax=Macrococcus bovicus TaxID=69968 RepID=UPI0025A4F14C|nr:hypothetical protein [Macrococcus bovicus]WJP96716.1 hypothetical protein QSV55_00320 [Macrococcus bovicus]
MSDYKFIAVDEGSLQMQEVVKLDVYKIEESKNSYNMAIFGYMGEGKNIRNNHDEVSLKNIKEDEG